MAKERIPKFIIGTGAKNTRVEYEDGTSDLIPNKKVPKDLPFKARDGSVTEAHVPRERLTVHQRYDYMKRLMVMVLEDVNPSVLITGGPGTGKTYELRKILDEKNKKEIPPLKVDEDGRVIDPDKDKKPHERGDYIIIKGHSSAFGLFRILHDYRHCTIIFDDCDSVFKCDISTNLLKGALDSYDTRTVAWMTPSAERAGLESVFEFKGRIIFISNLRQSKIDPAVLSRSFVTDISLNREEFLDRMTQMLPHVLPEEKTSLKEEVLIYLREVADNFNDFNMRTLVKAIRIRKSCKGDDWKDMIRALA